MAPSKVLGFIQGKFLADLIVGTLKGCFYKLVDLSVGVLIIGGLTFGVDVRPPDCWKPPYTTGIMVWYGKGSHFI